ncbi:hypothetical protein V8E54_007669 [Elaphomyces granulatus]
MDHQEILPTRKRADTMSPRRIPRTIMSGKRNDLAFLYRCQMMICSSDEDMDVDSDEGNDDFWKDQKVIVGGRLANPTSEQI